jgi:tetratricopeptide (TPR) repeat protein
VEWEERYERAAARYRGGEQRGLDQRQLTQLGNAAWAAGLCLLMAGREDEAAEWLRRAAARYRESWDAGAPPDSWGRPVAAMKALLLAGDDAGTAARWALDAGAAEADSPIGRYAATLALLVLGRDDEALALAATLRGRVDFPDDVAAALEALASHGGPGYAAALDDVLRSFETRDEFLEDVPVADTVLVLERLAAERGIASELRFSERLPRVT